jgi:hypothetical protein
MPYCLEPRLLGVVPSAKGRILSGGFHAFPLPRGFKYVDGPEQLRSKRNVTAVTRCVAFIPEEENGTLLSPSGTSFRIFPELELSSNGIRMD